MIMLLNKHVNTTTMIYIQTVDRKRQLASEFCKNFDSGKQKIIKFVIKMTFVRRGVANGLKIIYVWRVL